MSANNTSVGNSTDSNDSQKADDLKKVTSATSGHDVDASIKTPVSRDSKSSDSDESDDSHDISGHKGKFDFTLSGGSRDDTLTATKVGDYLITGGSGNDALIGGNGNDWLFGDSGDDRISGGAGNDYLMGDSGSDTLIGGAGNDDLDGGSDIDTAVFSGKMAQHKITIVGNSTKDSDEKGSDDTFWKGAIIADLRAGTPDGTDTVRHIEKLQFDDFTITFDGKNILPNAVGDALTTAKNTAVTVAASVLLGNDNDFIINSQGVVTPVQGTLSILGVGNAANGTVSYNKSSGQVTFVPKNNFTGTASFTYSVSDGQGGVSEGKVVVSVGGTAQNNVATISGTSTGSASEDGTLTASGKLTVTDADVGQSAAQVQSNVQGTYGKFSVDATGAWNYLLDNASTAVQGLAANQSVTDTFTVTSLDGSASKAVVVTVTGANDIATISGTSTGSASEDGTQTASGSLTVTDADVNQSAAQVQANVQGAYGKFSVNSTGAWSYALDNASTAVQGLKATDSVTDTFTVKSSDGSASQKVVVTVTGANDAAMIGGTISGTVTEAGGQQNTIAGVATAVGSLTVSDPDAGQSAFQAVSVPTQSIGGYGAFTLATNGAWIYTLNDSNAAVQALNVGGHLTDTFIAKTVDGTEQIVSITINGADDAPVVGGTASGVVTEAGGLANSDPGVPTATGTITFTDVDNVVGNFVAVTSPNPSAKGYGTYTVSSAGDWVYTLDNTNSKVQSLHLGETLADQFGVTMPDGTVKTVNISIAGAEDAAAIGLPPLASVTEDVLPTVDGNLVVGGMISVTDVDSGTTGFQSGAIAANGNLGSLIFNADGSYTYSVSNAAVQYLGANDKKVDTFTITATDGTTKDIQFVVNGANDAAVIGGDIYGDTTVTVPVTPGATITLTGKLTLSDPDSTNPHFVPVSAELTNTGPQADPWFLATSTSKGTAIYTVTEDGTWTYTLDTDALIVQAMMNSGLSYPDVWPGTPVENRNWMSDQFTVTTDDGTQTLVQIYITGILSA